MSAKKETKDKPDLSLIPYCVEVELAKAMMYGAGVYGRMNYTKGHDLTQIVSAAKRHLGKYLNGEECDQDSGVHHLGHVMANCLMLIHQRELGTLKDDRFVAEPIIEEFKVGDRVIDIDGPYYGVVENVTDYIVVRYPSTVENRTWTHCYDYDELHTLRHL